MEGLFLLIDELGEFFAPMFEADLLGFKVEVLDVVIVGVYHLLKDASALEVHLFMVFVQCGHTG
jgi:hypothetical protein